MRNIWDRFLSLLPEEPRLIGTIESVNDRVSVVLLLGGGHIRATSETIYQAGTRVFVKGGKIEGTAPTLTMENIIV